MKMIRLILIAAVGIASLSSCTKNDPAPALTATTFSNLAADPPSGGYNPLNGQPIGVTNKFTLFSFATGAIVANSDSATSNWDLGFRGTSIIVNGGTSGPGSAAAQVFTGLFAELTTAPATGFVQDDKNTVPNATYAIPRGSGNGWYNYDGATNVITPIAGRVIVVKCANGKYAKMEILSYYKDSPASPSSSDLDRYYTFRYIYQPDGSTKLQ